MAKYKGKYRIESNRAQFWDYSSPADYFITICVAERKCIFGHIENSKMILSEYGEIVAMEIKKIPQYHKRVIMDVWVVMPNHIHFIVSLGDDGFDNGISTVATVATVEKIHEFSLPQSQPPHPSQHQQWWHHSDYKPTIDEIKQYRKYRRKMLIPKIVGKFKQQTSKHINIIRDTPKTKNWQANYHDHIIRDDRAYQNISNYIINNPAKWQADKFNNENPNTDK